MFSSSQEHDVGKLTATLLLAGSELHLDESQRVISAGKVFPHNTVDSGAVAQVLAVQVRSVAGFVPPAAFASCCTMKVTGCVVVLVKGAELLPFVRPQRVTYT